MNEEDFQEMEYLREVDRLLPEVLMVAAEYALSVEPMRGTEGWDTYPPASFARSSQHGRHYHSTIEKTK